MALLFLPVISASVGLVSAVRMHAAVGACNLSTYTVTGQEIQWRISKVCMFVLTTKGCWLHREFYSLLKWLTCRGEKIKVILDVSLACRALWRASLLVCPIEALPWRKDLVPILVPTLWKTFACKLIISHRNSANRFGTSWAFWSDGPALRLLS